MKYINYAAEMKKVVLPRYQETKPEKPTGFVRPINDSKIKVDSKKQTKEVNVEETEENSLWFKTLNKSKTEQN